MKGFLKILVLFTLPLLLALVAGELVVRNYPNSYSYKDSYMQSHATEVETVIFGNSHTYYSINPKYLHTKAYNLANVSQTLEYDFKQLEKYFTSDSVNLKNVVVQLDFGNLFDYPLKQSPWDWQRVIYYRIYMGLDKNEHDFDNRFELSCMASFNKKLTPALQYLFTGKYKLDCDSLGFGITITPAYNQEKMKKALDEAMHRFETIDYSQWEYNAEFLYRIADFCQSRGIRMILIATPLWHEFAKHKSQDGNKELLQVAKTCVDRYGALYHDYSTDSRIVDEDFVDAEHMSPLGAKHFSAILTEDYGL